MEKFNKEYNIAKELEHYLQKVTYTAGLDKDIEKIGIHPINLTILNIWLCNILR